MPRRVEIEGVLNGFVCQVGCQRVVFNDVQSLSRAVEEYFLHPEETEKRYIEKAVNKMEGPVAPPQQTDSCAGQAVCEAPIRPPGLRR